MNVSPVPTLDLLCIGNAIVDVLAEVSHDALASLGSPPGGMTLIDAEQARSIEAGIMPSRVMGGGSAANTAVVARRLGASVGYLGKVADDAAGRHYAVDLRELGLTYPSAPVADADVPTARCIVLVTPDGQRTMHTYLGICTEFGPEDVDAATVRSAAITYMEGYLFDKPRAQAAFVHAAELAHGAGRQVALTLSDSFCVGRHKAPFRDLVAGHIDILFANEDEIRALYDAADIDEALTLAGRDTKLVAVTRGAQGAVVLADGKRHDVPTDTVTVVDTTGAGDAFAAGFLAGLTKERDLAYCAALGNRAAGAIITQIGARPEDDFALRA
ncbi:sugar kinase [Neoasaia chiangmaiensis NBRC 101099]|uniref:Carbohydrate kinase n=1 Tax=Neoasaia chiangmaiensis TaxID=320497 RepID=A0A1U9KP28_9PROT|nr:adenosine kinase [Neoasaia chiangmaiensis]AQS87556.1 carbohydrate kinase [Neoasaia chiangmaiensis]GBR42279.1 sugar kinase [Neoasaia chiangmaiensis NBRC 101099]GEN14104.1 adenosine kinase [Neoasaia chiangmaiensis]